MLSLCFTSDDHTLQVATLETVSLMLVNIKATTTFTFCLACLFFWSFSGLKPLGAAAASYTAGGIPFLSTNQQRQSAEETFETIMT